MAQKYLITVGDDPQYLYGVRFAAAFFTNKTDIRISLLYVAPRFDSADAHENERLHRIDVQLSELYRKKGEKSLAESRKILLAHQFAEEQITSQSFYRVHGTVTDIVEYTRSGGFDATLLGKRGYSIFERGLGSSVSEALIDLQIDFPVWIVRDPQPDRKNVLLCVDGSAASLHAADHVAFVLERQEDHGVTLFHMRREESGDPEKLLEQVRLRLSSKIDQRRIGELILEGGRVSESIMRAAAKGRFAAVAIGRRGHSVGSPAEKYLGSTCVNLLYNLKGAALWVKW